MKESTKCKICGNNTEQYFNINFKQVLICDDCETCIVKQSVEYKYRKVQPKQLPLKESGLLKCASCCKELPWTANKDLYEESDKLYCSNKCYKDMLQKVRILRSKSI